MSHSRNRTTTQQRHQGRSLSAVPTKYHTPSTARNKHSKVPLPHSSFCIRHSHLPLPHPRPLNSHPCYASKLAPKNAKLLEFCAPIQTLTQTPANTYQSTTGAKLGNFALLNEVFAKRAQLPLGGYTPTI